MHEMSLSSGMLDIIEQQAREQCFARVRVVRLELGVLSCVEPEALAFCFDSVTRGSVAEGATLDIVSVPGSAWCWDCEAVVSLLRRGEACARCGGYGLQVRGGEQIRIKELEVD
jgi:hydrogenase nickel incorporation protein HypA/HybF